MQKVSHWKERKCMHSGKMFVLMLVSTTLHTFWVKLEDVWRVCHLKCMTNPESDSEDGERLTCSQSTHFMGEELSGLPFFSTFQLWACCTIRELHFSLRLHPPNPLPSHRTWVIPFLKSEWLFLSIYPKELETMSTQKPAHDVYSSLFIITKTGKQPRCISVGECMKLMHPNNILFSTKKNWTMILWKKMRKP